MTLGVKVDKTASENGQTINTLFELSKHKKVVVSKLEVLFMIKNLG